ncbi:uncharacterized protein DNG_04919 [Cephalotrichum gorgonifer]|uniref:Acetylserotonin methytransferase-like protein n=1 Tax=Cephalotrichum gorgonifer TaxID=2041049 RepID=A0AAE8MX22_9PEZI|nr:uncharacterized protein DNG_04919 [Cephalotrichum gorgonifer]
MSPQPPAAGGFSLFPNTASPPPGQRRQTPRPSTSSSSPVENIPHHPTVVIPGPYSNPGQTPPPGYGGRQTPQARVASPVHQPRQSQEQQQPRQPADVPDRSETAFSQAQTLVLRSASTRSRSSIAKKPLYDDNNGDEPPPIRSIFPQPMYSPEPVTPRSPPPHIDAVAAAPQPHWAPHAQQPTGPPPQPPPISTTEELKAMWKAANGWKASQSEGQVFCLGLTQERDAPVYTLSSSTQAFYNMRVDPTSASAYITLSRHDPSKVCKGPPPSTSPSAATPTTPGSFRSRKSNGGATTKQAWQEVLCTTLEEEPRRHRPNDGLVADLSPAAAIRMATEKPDDEGAVALAERECARLVWDDDSASHYLVHPALATPFCVTIERHPASAWGPGRVEYTLEHHESPNHLARLTREATGDGHLEIDTALASKIESFFVVDVAVAALLVVASGDKSFEVTAAFDPPPPVPAAIYAPPGSGIMPDHFSLRSQSRVDSAPTTKGGRLWKKKATTEDIEMQDVESQESYGGPGKVKKAQKPKKVKGDRIRDGLPWPVRIAVTPGIWFAKAVIWMITAVLKTFVWVLKGVAKKLGLIGTTK